MRVRFLELIEELCVCVRLVAKEHYTYPSFRPDMQGITPQLYPAIRVNIATPATNDTNTFQFMYCLIFSNKVR
jgi:hypothetical protein